ncbi:hypothetical protein HJG60_008939 [Phyllostomus discolor]|uniref:Uncharacterized protein n=1 Tax=Phyllostomus discolor TaxID=89673 RepID=A0A833YML5_9CHIR|nr:hypothetical protein HJG60_008939 [Phyllostomus discolor]
MRVPLTQRFCFQELAPDLFTRVLQDGGERTRTPALLFARCYSFDLTRNKDWATGDPNYTQVTLKMIPSLTCSVPSLEDGQNYGGATPFSVPPWERGPNEEARDATQKAVGKSKPACSWISKETALKGMAHPCDGMLLWAECPAPPIHNPLCDGVWRWGPREVI